MQQTELRRPPAARNGQLAASEVSDFTDPITGCAVRQLTGAALRSVHSYYDIPPWSPTSGQIAFTRLAAEGSGGDICIMERDGSDLRTVAQTREVTLNDGAYPQWSADGERVYFRDRDGDRQLVGVLEAASGRVERLSGSLRMLSPAGHHNAYHTAFDRLPDHVVRDGKADHGVFVQDLASGVSRRLVSCADCLALHPRRTEVAGWHLYLKHCKWSPDGSRLLFVFTNEIRYADKYGELPRVKDVYVIDADGSGLRRVGEFGNHPIWHPNGCEVLTNSPYPGRPGNSLVLTDVDSGAQRLASAAIAGNGHPSFSPDGNMIAVDHVLQREGYGSIDLVHTADDRVEHLVEMRVLDHSHVGTHLHPVWSRDGRQLLYASDASGCAQLCVVDAPG